VDVSFTSEVIAVAPVDIQPDFDRFARAVGDRLRVVLVARYGVELGNDACAEALAFAWERRETVLAMENPAGYLYRVAQTAVRRDHRRRRVPDLPVEAPVTLADPEPGLHDALRRLTEDQRVAVVLVHGYGWRYQEVADVLGVPVSTVRNHLHRGLKRLRRLLGGTHGA
jgi:RNA polymerase sigma factor (sigma-70 family)